MRPTSLLSAALCGVLWTTSNLVAAQVGNGLGDSISRCGQYETEECRARCIADSLDDLVGCVKIPAAESTSLVTDGNMVTYLITTTTFGPAGPGTATITTIGPEVFTSTLPNGVPITSTRSALPSSSGSADSGPVAGVPTDSTLQATTIAATRSTSPGTASTPTSPASAGANASSLPATQGKSKTGAIIGGVIGGIFAVVLILLGAFFIRRRRRSSSKSLDEFGALEKNRGSSSPSVYPSPVAQAISYDTPAPLPSQNTPGEGHRLMSGYADMTPDQGIQVVPVVVGSKPYAVGTTEREVDDDGVSLRSPSPTLVGSDAGGRRDHVPRLPIYNRGSDETPRGPAL